MRALRIDFAVRRHVRPALGYALAAALFVFAAAQAREGLELQRQAVDLEARLAAAQQAADERARAARPAPRPEPPYLRDALAVVRAAEYDVGRVLTALETVRVPGVKVTSIEIVPAEDLARVDLELSDAAALTQYLDELNAGLEPSQRWRLLRLQSPQGNVPGSASVAADPSLARR